MIRRLFTFTSALSLLLCVATVALWVRSYCFDDGIGFGTGYHVESDWGRLWIERLSDLEHAYTWRPGRYAIRIDMHSPWDEFAAPGDKMFGVCGVGYYRGRRAVRSYHPGPDLDGLWDVEPVRAVFAPHWAVLLLTAVLPTMVCTHIARRTVRSWKCRCAFCGYDLRATPDRCPECRRPVPENAQTRCRMRTLIALASMLAAGVVGCAQKCDCELIAIAVPMTSAVQDCVARADATAEQQITRLNANPRYKDSGPSGRLHLANYAKTFWEGCIRGRPVIEASYQLVEKNPNRIHFLDGPDHFDVVVYIDSDETRVAW